MAIDTAEKRRSVVGVNFFSGPGVTPLSSKDQEWRQESGYGYSGILVTFRLALDGVTAGAFTLDGVVAGTLTVDAKVKSN